MATIKAHAAATSSTVYLNQDPTGGEMGPEMVNGGALRSATTEEPDTPVDDPVAFLVLLRHHWLDWVFGIVMIVVGFVLASITPHERSFFPGDESISYAWKEDTYPSWALVFPFVLVPLVVILVWSGLARGRWDEVHRAGLGLVVAAGMTLLTTDCLKTVAGRLRPDFIDACQPLADAVKAALAAPYGPSRTLGPVFCTGDVVRIHDARQSFPSGHTSTSFCGLGFLSCYLFERGTMAGRRLRAALPFYKTDFPSRRMSTLGLELLVVLAPLLLATLIGISRVDDNKHHATDVIAGALIGLFSAIVAWFHFVRRPVSVMKGGRLVV